MPAEYAAKAAAMLIAMNAIAAPLPEVSAETSTVTCVEVLAGPDQVNEWRNDLLGTTVNAGCAEN
jgi:hypothetical protein